MPTYNVNPVTSEVPPWAVQQRIGTAAGRYALDSVLMPRTDEGLSYIDYRSGVMASGDGGTTHLAMQVTPGSGMAVEVAQGNGVVNTPNQGAYFCCLDSVKTIEVPASSSTTTRYDLVVASVRDDNNSALASDPGDRNFVVELIQGDTTTGTPTIPQPPVGSIPLASLYIGRNVTDLTGTDPHRGKAPAIQDLRGAGLVARGGMRVLYGADAQPGAEEYERPGAYPGDQRWVHTNHFQHQVYYGKGEDPKQSGWRGVHNALVYNARPNPKFGGTWMLRKGSQRLLCYLDIPYPGTPFMIYPSAIVRATMSSWTVVDHLITFTNENGAVISSARVDSGVGRTGVDGDTHQGWTIPPIMWGILTDTVRVCLIQRVRATAYPGGSGGVGFTAYDLPAESLLSVVVYPSTVAPPIWPNETAPSDPGGEERPDDGE